MGISIESAVWLGAILVVFATARLVRKQLERNSESRRSSAVSSPINEFPTEIICETPDQAALRAIVGNLPAENQIHYFKAVLAEESRLSLGEIRVEIAGKGVGTLTGTEASACRSVLRRLGQPLSCHAAVMRMTRPTSRDRACYAVRLDLRTRLPLKTLLFESRPRA